MENKRENLAEQLEMIGELFEIEDLVPLFVKFDENMSVVRFNAVVIQISGVLLAKNRGLADKLVAFRRGVTLDEVAEMSDADYGLALRDAITMDAIGFFVSSQPSAGKK
jgi:hypothetical protein